MAGPPSEEEQAGTDGEEQSHARNGCRPHAIARTGELENAVGGGDLYLKGEATRRPGADVDVDSCGLLGQSGY